jgi:type IX secretion system PorP/SprF family membrane protein
VKKLIYIFGLLLLFVNKLQGVDPQFTQFYSVPLYLGPSFAGATQQHRLSGTIRQQWAAIPGAFSTYALAYDQSFSKYNSGLGLIFMRDVSGSGRLGTSYASILYSYDFVLFNTFHIRPGLSFIYSMYSLDFSKLKFSDQIGPYSSNPNTKVLAPTDENRGNVDGSASSLFYTDKIWVGFTVDHLLKPNLSFYGDQAFTPIKITFYGGAKIISKGRLLKPVDETVSLAYLAKYQGDALMLDLGLYWFNSPIVFGAWYRGIPLYNSNRGDAVAFLVGLKKYDFSLAYSYDFTISRLINSTRGSHEISLIYEFHTQQKKKYHAIPCPEF